MINIKSISCCGFRGFSEKQTLDLAIPNGKAGSGLTMLVGPNGGGKSTIVECFQKLSISKDRGVTFSKGRRNIRAGDVVEITIVSEDGLTGTLKTVNGGSQTHWNGEEPPSIYYLPSRRFFNPFFNLNRWNRDTYLKNQYENQFRSSTLDQYTSRLIDLDGRGARKYNEVLSRIIGKAVEWTIDQEDNGQYFVKITKQDGLYHNSDGLGEGILSLMFIVDALCGQEDEVIVIDEPELSLHPQLQKRLLREIMEKSKESQVVISTHSPNMISLEAIANDAMIARVFESSDDRGSQIKMIDKESQDFIKSNLRNVNNPHVLGLDARSCFFAEDRMIITEGQEDVLLYPVVLKELSKDYEIPFFGFGAGGASSIRKVAHLLHVLGFEKVGAIFDGDKEDDYKRFNEEFSDKGFKAWIIPAKDIRDKEAHNEPHVDGLLGENRHSLKPQYKEELSALFDEMMTFLETQ